MLQLLIEDMERSLEMITKWLRQSGLKVNHAKMEICLFHRNDLQSIKLNVNYNLLKNKDHINVLGIIFDTMLQWHLEVSNAISKSSKALHAISLIKIKKYFTSNELLAIITSKYLSILHYNTDVWLLPTLSP